MRQPRPTIVSELRALQRHYKLNQSRMAEQLGLSRGHYSEVLSGKRGLPYRAACLAYNLGVPAQVLLSLHNLEKSPPGSS